MSAAEGLVVLFHDVGILIIEWHRIEDRVVTVSECLVGLLVNRALSEVLS